MRIEHCILNFETMKDQPYNVGLDEANLSKEELAYKYNLGIRA